MSADWNMTPNPSKNNLVVFCRLYSVGFDDEKSRNNEAESILGEVSYANNKRK